MLKDLEKRRGKTENTDASKGLQSSTVKTKKSRTLPYTIIVLIIIVFAAVYFLWFSNYFKASTFDLNKHTQTVKQMVDKAKQLKAATPKITSVEYQHNANTAKLILQFSRKPHTSMNLTPDHSAVTLGVGKATLTGQLPAIQKQNFFTSLNYMPGTNNTLKVGLANHVTITSLHASTQAPYTLTLTISIPKTAITAAPKSQKSANIVPIEKHTLPSTPDQIRTATFNRLLNALLKPKHQAALIGMRSFANENPNYIPAQVALTTYYAKNKNYMKSLGVINPAIQNNPDDISLVTLKARILVAQNQIKSASNLLSQYSPKIKKHPNFYVLIAAVEQQMGNSELSAQYYQELIDTDVSNGKYWLGYGLALKKLGRNNAAVRAFKQALTSEDVNANLKAYLRTQIEMLGA